MACRAMIINQTASSISTIPTVSLMFSLRNLLRLLISEWEIWLGCKEGILAYQPERIHTTRLQYPIYIIGGEVNNRDIRS